MTWVSVKFENNKLKNIIIIHEIYHDMANNNPYHLIQCKFSPIMDVVMVCLLKRPLNFDHDNFIASLMITFTNLT